MNILILQTIILYCSPAYVEHYKCHKKLIECVDASVLNGELAVIRCIREDLAKK